MQEGRNGITANTPKHILFGAGTIHKGLKYTTDKWNFAESLVGATNGGSKLSIVPEIYNVPLDGANVLVKEAVAKVGETANMEINFAEITEDIIKAATFGTDGESTDTTYNLIESKDDIVAGDFWENIAFVGKTLEGKNIIAIMDNALCTSGFETEGKPKESAVGACTFACHASLEDASLNKLPWHIYYPKATT